MLLAADLCIQAGCEIRSHRGKRVDVTKGRVDTLVVSNIQSEVNIGNVLAAVL